MNKFEEEVIKQNSKKLNAYKQQEQEFYEAKELIEIHKKEIESLNNIIYEKTNLIST